MKLKTLLEYFLELSVERFENGYIGQLLDAKKEKSLGIYLNESDTRIRTIKNSEKPCSVLDITLLVRYNTSYSETEEVAWELYQKIEELKNDNVEIGDFDALLILKDEYPIPSIKREGIWEQIIRVQIYYKQKKPVTMFTYVENDDGTISITGLTDEYKEKMSAGEVSSDIVIPAVYDGKNVTSINSGSFGVNTQITGITIESGIKGILSHAFVNCNTLEKITINEGSILLLSSSVGSCMNLKEVYIANGVKIDQRAFYSSIIENMTIDNSEDAFPPAFVAMHFGARSIQNLIFLR